jgi:hypothetical protein
MARGSVRVARTLARIEKSSAVAKREPSPGAIQTIPSYAQ